MFLLLILAVVCLVLVQDYLRKCSYRWKKLSEFPGDNPLPIVGNALQLGFDADESSHQLMDMWRRHGKTNFRLSVGAEDWVMLSNADDVATILNHPSELSKPLERNNAMKPFFGNSVSSSEGDRWKTTRKLMAPSFQYSTLDKRIDDVSKYCEQLYQYLDAYDGMGPLEIYTYLRPYMLDILSDSLMGVEFKAQEDLNHPYLHASGQIVRIITENYFSYWRNIRPIFVLTPIYRDMMKVIKTIRSTSLDLINARRRKLEQIKVDIINNNHDIEASEILEKKLSDSGCLLDKFLLGHNSSGEPIPDEMIADEVSLVCFTGHYTTTMTMSHTLYCLAKYPEVQKKVLEEQRSIIKDDMNRNPTNQELNQMKYLEAVIKESIRVLPTVTKIGRQIHGDLKFKDGRVAPAGSSVIVFYEAMYQDPTIFPEPAKYDPERFMNTMHTFAFVPFSAGPRNCIGFRYAWVVMKATLSNLLRRYEIIPGGIEPQFAYRIITESKNGLHLRLKKRKY